MNGIIVYESKYGSTKKYVDWLKELTNFDAIETSKAKIDEVIKYDVVILGGGIYAMGVAGLSFLRKNISSLKDKKVIVFCDGASPYEAKAFEEIKAHNMKDELKDIPFFYCRGGWDLDRMSFLDRNMCKMLRKSVSKKDPSSLELWEKALLEAGKGKCDWTDEKYLQPILEELKK